MNTILKYFLYFLFGFIIYLLLNYKKVEGFENELSLLFSILRDRTDVGCQNYVCDQDPWYVNSHSIWYNKINVKDENFYLCNNSPEYSIVSTLNSGNKCNKELCCEDRSCNKKFFNKGYHCFNRLEQKDSECPIGVDSESCRESCCGFQLEGAGKILYDSVIIFKQQVLSNSTDSDSDSYSCPNTPFVLANHSNSDIISLLDIRNYQYFYTLDLENMEIENLNTTLEEITYCDFEKIQAYLTKIYNDIIIDSSSDTDKIDKFKTSELDSIKIKDDFIDSDMNVSQYVNRLTDNSETENILSQRIYGMVSKNEIQDKYTNFLRNYTNYDDDTETNNTHEELIKSIKLTMLLLGNPSLNSFDNDRTPMDSLIGNDSQEYYNRTISNTDLQLIL